MTVAKILLAPIVTSSCPALCRASTSCFPGWKRGVDGRDKPGHDDGEADIFIGIQKFHFLRICSFTSTPDRRPRSDRRLTGTFLRNCYRAARLDKTCGPSINPLPDCAGHAGMPQRVATGGATHDPSCIRDRGLSRTAAPAARGGGAELFVG